MKRKLIIFIISTLSILLLSFIATVNADTSIWREDFNYSSVSELEAAGWAIGHSEGITFTSSGVILDGSDDDTHIHFQNVPAGTYNWAAEVKSRWLGTGHSGCSVGVSTQEHSYIFMPDGYYDNYAFYRDNAKVKTFEGYEENLNAYMTLRMEKSGNLIELYYNGQLIGTYTEVDTTPSQIIGANMVSPWKGDAEYDYFEVWSISGDLPAIVPTPTISLPTTTFPTESPSTSVFSNPIVIGGIIGGVGVGVGAAVYYFVIAGGSGAAASAGAGSGTVASAGASAGSDGGSSSGGGTLIHPSSSVPSTLQSNEANTLNEVAMNEHKPNSIESWCDHIENFAAEDSTNNTVMNEMLTDQAEQNAANHSLQQCTQSVHDTVNAIDQHIHNNQNTLQQQIHQQTNQLLQGSNKPNAEVADSGSSGGES